MISDRNLTLPAEKVGNIHLYQQVVILKIIYI